MAREIKFRVWNPDHETMYDGPFMFQPSQDYDHVETPFTYYYDWMDFEDGIKRPCYVMQYTGLKDKNGVEIYEGDILKFTHDTSMLNWAVEANVFGGYSIYNLNGHPSAIRYPVDSPSFFIDREVIGNIYQNPELLKH